MNTLSVNQAAELVVAAIKADLEPDEAAACASFSDVHDYTDANVYLADVLGDDCADEANLPHTNAVADRASALITAGALTDDEA